MSVYVLFVFFRQKTAYEMRISDWSSDVCSSDLQPERRALRVDAVHRIFAAGNFHRFARGGAAVGADRCKRAVDIVDADIIRSEERRVGQECVSTCRSRLSPDHYKKTKPCTQTQTSLYYYNHQ